MFALSLGVGDYGEVSDSPERARTAGGIYEGFEGYRTPSETDYEAVLNSGLVVPDANVLLNLYRYNRPGQDALLDVLEKLAERIWVPHQVMREFWRNRESALRDPRETATKAIEQINEAGDAIQKAIRTWKNRIALPEDQEPELERQVSGFVAELARKVESLTDTAPESHIRSTSEDRVLQHLERIFDGRVGGRLDSGDERSLVEEARRRFETKTPPGYLDAGKSGDDDAGDYIIWAEVLREAKSRELDVLVVTGDVKEDWWRKSRGEVRGPRLELVKEMRESSGRRLLMLRTQSFLRKAIALLDVQVPPESLDSIERIERARVHSSGEGWGPSTIRELYSRMASRTPIRARVLVQAAKNGGHIAREEIYQIGEYHEDRTLRAYTRPIRRITQELRDEGLLSEDAEDVLEAVYDDPDHPTRASGFRLAAGLSSAVGDALEHVISPD